MQRSALAVRCKAGAVTNPELGTVPALRSGMKNATASGTPTFLPQRNKLMSNTEIEIVVDDPTAPEPDSPPIADTRTVDVIVSLLLMALALTLGFDNWRTGIAWDSTGPQAGYFPFYL
jgi:hypothetical protein